MMNANDRKIFEDAFYLGFMTAFDGWNGETFSIFERKPRDSDLLMAALQTRIAEYNGECNEKAKLFPLITGDNNG